KSASGKSKPLARKNNRVVGIYLRRRDFFFGRALAFFFGADLLFFFAGFFAFLALADFLAFGFDAALAGARLGVVRAAAGSSSSSSSAPTSISTTSSAVSSC